MRVRFLPALLNWMMIRQLCCEEASLDHDFLENPDHRVWFCALAGAETDGMIVYVCTARKQFVFSAYLAYWGAELRERFRLLSYEEFFGLRKLERASYVFADIERLSPGQRERVARYWRLLRVEWPEARLLNHPLRVKRRYRLLRDLNRAGINRFDVFRPEEERQPGQFPVFIRRSNDHTGPETGLLNNPGELEAALGQLSENRDLEDLLITEFCATPDSQGRFWKYSAFIFGDRIVPAHLFVSHDWCVKAPMRIDQTVVDAEYDYVSGNPHEDVLRAAARIGNIDYGRIDYGLVDGQVQIYEINTHPQVMGPVDNFYEQRQPARELSAKLLQEGFESFDTPSGHAARVTAPSDAAFQEWREPGAGYTVCRRLLKSVGRESATPNVFEAFRKFRKFAAEKSRRVLAPFAAVKSRKAGRASPR